ncbi:triphosphoribosyl-dephospho-CoA synthase MdcB [Methylocella silvestris BL2]|uniref:Probable 2-(5''-triphosphoribosyl)-3'-dephosphocoenzyme-A synthase n=1 Tax=Methylocella silvestris (strain DSM 15510 / CIP 108128 / LMG 27833 / NCIMB 13906 / BL2) TaxID=395965 RepID=B8EMG6_METSB|nr:triphosphoribosyl-dephospho-CoA synthase MdcB [Methylocella silvestris]ACK52094.1 triphosphoribosyl-dephospho-CoA synthase MdcB [Methylocella silvestris BL2]
MSEALAVRTDAAELAPPLHPNPSPRELGALAVSCLQLEVETYPKPGLVSHIDNGSHGDMDAALLHRSARALEPFFVSLAEAGAAGAGMDRLRAIGVAAEAVMLKATSGVNTHRGAIFGLGLLCAAAGAAREESLGLTVRRRYGRAIAEGPVPLRSHGAEARRNFGASGARGEAAAGFPTVYQTGAPALIDGLKRSGGDFEAARVQAIFALIARVTDTNLLHRGAAAGLVFAQSEARGFLQSGGVGAADWRDEAARIHAAFVARRLSPGGSADLLAFSLFVHALEHGDPAFEAEPISCRPHDFSRLESLL